MIDEDERRDMTILAIDASLNRPGFAVLHITKDGKASVVTTCVVNNKYSRKDKTTGMKIQEIGSTFHYLCTLYKPDVLVRERGFSRYANTTQALFRVVGALDFIAYNSFDKEIAEITPKAIKRMVTGSGKAGKEDVAASLERYVGKFPYMADDESDAVAVGVTYAISEGLIEYVHPIDGKNKTPDDTGEDGEDDEDGEDNVEYDEP